MHHSNKHETEGCRLLLLFMILFSNFFGDNTFFFSFITFGPLTARSRESSRLLVKGVPTSSQDIRSVSSVSQHAWRQPGMGVE